MAISTTPNLKLKTFLLISFRCPRHVTCLNLLSSGSRVLRVKMSIVVRICYDGLVTFAVLIVLITCTVFNLNNIVLNDHNVEFFPSRETLTISSSSPLPHTHTLKNKKGYLDKFWSSKNCRVTQSWLLFSGPLGNLRVPPTCQIDV